MTSSSADMDRNSTSMGPYCCRPGSGQYCTHGCRDRKGGVGSDDYRKKEGFMTQVRDEALRSCGERGGGVQKCCRAGGSS